MIVLKPSEAYAGLGEKEMSRKNFGKSWQDILLTLKVLLTNPTWVLLTITGTFQGGAITSFSTFLPKFLQFQFNLTPSIAAIVAGLYALNYNSFSM